MKDIKDLIKRDVEKEFFDLDQKNGVAHIELSYEKPSDIFDCNTKTKVPKMSDEFIDWVIRSFELVPNKYKLDVDIVFDDMEGYTEEELLEICQQNILLEIRIRKRRTRRENSLAMSLCAIGLIFIFASIYIGRVWTDGGSVQEIVSFVLDILATVPFWAATEIYVVNSSERRKTLKNLLWRFHAISFRRRDGA